MAMISQKGRVRRDAGRLGQKERKEARICCVFINILPSEIGRSIGRSVGLPVFGENMITAVQEIDFFFSLVFLLLVGPPLLSLPPFLVKTCKW